MITTTACFGHYQSIDWDRKVPLPDKNKTTWVCLC